MKRHFLPLIYTMLLLLTGVTCVNAQTPLITMTTIDAENYEGSISFSLSGSEEDFKGLLIDAGYGKKPANEVNKDGKIPLKGNVVKIYGTCRGFVAPMDRVKNIEFAENQCIKQLSLMLNDFPQGLDLSANKALENVSFISCGMQSLDFSKLPTTLKHLYLSSNELTSVDLSGLPRLETIYVDENPQIKSIDFSKNPNLYRINISSNPLISSVDLAANKELVVFEAWDCNLPDLDLSQTDLLENISIKNSKVKNLKFGKTDKIQVLDISKNAIKTIHTEEMPALRSLAVGSNTEMTTLDVSKCPQLVSLSIDTTKISELDLTKCPSLEILTASKSALKSLDLSKNPLLNQLSIEDCQSFTALDISKNPKLRILIIAGNKLGFDATKEIANNLSDLPNTDEIGVWGVFLEKTPEDLNKVSKEAVGIALKKKWEVVARNTYGDFYDYTGIDTGLKEIEKQPKGVLLISVEKNSIKVNNLPQGYQKKVNIFDEKGNLIVSGVTNDNSILFDGLENLHGVFIVECNGAIGKGIIR